MVRNRKGLAPWSLAREAGIESATVDGTIEVPQYVQPVLDTGFVDEKGDWKGSKSSDRDFFIHQTDIEVANGADFTSPSTNADGSWPLSMVGYTDMFLAIKPTNGGNYAMTGVMASNTVPFYNLSPTNAAAALRGVKAAESGSGTVNNILYDAAENLTVDVWNIFILQSIMRQQPNLMFKFTNNSGDISTIETAFMRLV
jgi:hypothetical protein